MPFSAVFDQADIPRAERIVGADVADVYAVLEALDRWSTWVTAVNLHVSAVDAERFDVSWVADGEMKSRKVAVIARGRTYSLSFDVDGRWRMHFRTRPHQSGTHIQAVAEPVKPSRWTQSRNRRRLADYSARLDSLLDQLAIRVERS
jgi:hypothetical protein